MAFFRNLLRYVGLILILAIYVVSGLHKIMDPSAGAAMLAKSNFPKMIAPLGVVLGMEEFIYVIQATGVIFLSFSLFILLGVGRSFFSFLMAIGTIIITVAFFVNLDDPLNVTEENGIHIMQNLGLVGGFLFVAGSGHRSQKYSKAHQEAQHNAKKNH
ncbi:DoxX [Angomonas deanei]|nr:DoxX [Angomonas deanei]EPY40303.1 DoxX [Angomonas deanei]|eukprot:EPY40060.1 DoxX [Angomonas deanei]